MRNGALFEEVVNKVGLATTKNLNTDQKLPHAKPPSQDRDQLTASERLKNSIRQRRVATTIALKQQRDAQTDVA